MKLRLRLLIIVGSIFLAGCQTSMPNSTPLVDDFDLERFMGDWYVIANIPTFLEKEAHNAVESYALEADKTVATAFRFRKGAFDGPLKVYNPTGFVNKENNAVWGMQFVWPIKAEYLVMYVDPTYQHTIIGRSKRDYVWIMAREPRISEEDYRELFNIVRQAGYDTENLQRVPQRWPEAGDVE